MNLNRGSRSGFTLIEVLVAIVLIGIGVTAVVASLGSLTSSFRRSVETENLQRLAHEKFDELIATGEWVSVSQGGFEGERYSDYTWSVESETTSIAGLEYMKVTVTRTFAGREDTAFADGLTYTPATTTVPLEPGI